MALDNVHTVLDEEIAFLQALERAAAPFIGNSPAASRIIDGWKGTLTVLVGELEELKQLDDAGLKARLGQEIDLSVAFLGTLNQWGGHPDAGSWRSFFLEEIEIAQGLMRIL